MVSIMVLIYKDMSIIIHNGHDHGCHNLCNRRIIIIEEGVFKHHDIVADKVILMDNEEGGLWCCPDVPVEEQGALEIGYPPNVVGGDGLMLGVMGAHEIWGDNEEVGGKEGVSQKRVTLAVSTAPLLDGENAMTPGPVCFSQR